MGTCGTLKGVGRAMSKPKGWSGVGWCRPRLYAKWTSNRCPQSIGTA